MNDITDNLFSNSFIESMTRNIEPDICEDYISRDEIESCWERGIPYRYKYFNSSDNADLFIQANSDGSSDLVKLVRPEGALLASDVKFVVVRKLSAEKAGPLYRKMYGRRIAYNYRTRRKKSPVILNKI